MHPDILVFISNFDWFLLLESGVKSNLERERERERGDMKIYLHFFQSETIFFHSLFWHQFEARKSEIIGNTKQPSAHIPSLLTAWWHSWFHLFLLFMYIDPTNNKARIQPRWPSGLSRQQCSNTVEVLKFQVQIPIG